FLVRRQGASWILPRRGGDLDRRKADLSFEQFGHTGMLTSAKSDSGGLKGRDVDLSRSGYRRGSSLASISIMNGIFVLQQTTRWTRAKRGVSAAIGWQCAIVRRWVTCGPTSPRR